MLGVKRFMADRVCTDKHLYGQVSKIDRKLSSQRKEEDDRKEGRNAEE